VFATLMRIAHWAPIYAIVAVLLAVIFTLIAEFVSNSMNADETRPVMKLL